MAENTALISVKDEETGWICRLYKWWPYGSKKYCSGFTIYDETGRERVHCGSSKRVFTKEAAMDALKTFYRFVKEQEKEFDEYEKSKNKSNPK